MHLLRCMYFLASCGILVQASHPLGQQKDPSSSTLQEVGLRNSRLFPERSVIAQDPLELTKRPRNAHLVHKLDMGMQFAGLGKRASTAKQFTDFRSNAQSAGLGRGCSKLHQRFGNTNVTDAEVNNSNEEYIRKRLDKTFQFAGLGKKMGPNMLYAGLGKKMDPAFQLTGLGKRLDNEMLFTGLGKRMDQNVLLAGLGKKMDPAYELSGLGKRIDHNMMFNGLGKKMDHGMMFTGLGKKMDPSMMFNGLGKKMDPSMMFNGLGKKMDHSMMFTGLGKKMDHNLMFTGLGKKTDFKHQAAYLDKRLDQNMLFSGLGKKMDPTFQLAGLGKKMDPEMKSYQLTDLDLKICSEIPRCAKTLSSAFPLSDFHEPGESRPFVNFDKFYETESTSGKDNKMGVTGKRSSQTKFWETRYGDQEKLLKRNKRRSFVDEIKAITNGKRFGQIFHLNNRRIAVDPGISLIGLGK